MPAEVSVCECPDCRSGGPTYSESYRLACEARQVRQWDRDARTAYYALVAEKRGQPAAKRLIEAVNAGARGE